MESSSLPTSKTGIVVVLVSGSAKARVENDMEDVLIRERLARV